MTLSSPDKWTRSPGCLGAGPLSPLPDGGVQALPAAAARGRVVVAQVLLLERGGGAAAA